MFDNPNLHYSNSLEGDSFSSCHSANSSFSDGSSATWDSSTNYTPMSTPRRGSPTSIKYENSVTSAPLLSSPDHYGTMNGFSAMTSMTQSMMSMYHEPQTVFAGPLNTTSAPRQAMAAFNYGPYLDHSMGTSFSSHGLPMSTPSLIHDDMYSPVSEMSLSPPRNENCIAPSQTTFDTFGLQSPMKPLQFNMNYDCPTSDYDAGFLPDNSSPEDMGFLLPEYPHYKSEHSTPSRSPHKRLAFSQSHGSDSLADLRHELEAEASEAKRFRLARKRSKGGRTYETFASSIGVNPKAAHSCDWEGCTRKFARHEHLKRHQKTHDDEKEPCEFCPKPFSKSRRDNYKTHLRLHAFPQKGNRTKFFPEARAVWEAMENKPRKTTVPTFKNKRTVQRVARLRI